ncbi:MAG: ImmA/IrrE family metallo-endopeptidase, partial [Acidimicrobiia bacterium]|nr:ImmA/IrrE family metallo-endopeptidase [Acidimicrobiia bacterium]
MRDDPTTSALKAQAAAAAAATAPTPANDRKAKVEALQQEIELGVTQLRSSEGWKEWLDASSKFHNYSFGNQMLILSRRPDATRVAGYRTWEQLDRHVNKGEKGIPILAPTVLKKVDEDGEEHRITTGFRVVHVFDVSQTDGKALPEPPAHRLQGEAPPGLQSALDHELTSRGFVIERPDGPYAGEANGDVNFASRTVRIRSDLSAAQQAKTTAHELAHALMHEHEATMPREQKELEAESVAYVVCKSQGLDTSDYSFGYVAAWTNADTKAVRASAERVRKTAGAIIDSLPDDSTSGDAGSDATAPAAGPLSPAGAAVADAPPSGGALAGS